MIAEPSPDGVPFRLLEMLLSAIGGSLVTVVAFGTKLAISDRRHKEHEEEFKKLYKTIGDNTAELRADLAETLTEHKEMIAGHRSDVIAETMRTERAFRESLESMRRDNDARHEENRVQWRLVRKQQFLQLKMMADMARHSGADKRFDDAIWRALAADKEDEE